MSSLYNPQVLLLFANAIHKTNEKKKDFVSSKLQTIDLTMCRICNDEKGDVPIFHNENQPNVPEEIFNFSGVTLVQISCKSCTVNAVLFYVSLQYKVSEIDNFPQKMCQCCLDLLNGCIMFRDLCQKTNMEMVELSIKKESIKQECDDNFNTVSIGDDFNAPSLCSDNPDDYECSKCNNIFSDSKSYKKHLKECKKTLRRLKQSKKQECDTKLKDSKKTHKTKLKLTKQNKDQGSDKHLKDGKKPPRRRKQYEYKFLCDTCGKICQSRGKLESHLTTHENIFPFKCDECPYRGRTEDLLKVHKRSHMAEKPYKCTLCPRATTTASNLARHMAHLHSSKPDMARSSTHTKTYRCDYCEKTFIYRYLMRQHIQNIHLKAASVECNVCFKMYANRKSLLRHRSKAHNLKREIQGGRLPAYLLVQQNAPDLHNMETDDRQLTI